MNCHLWPCLVLYLVTLGVHPQQCYPTPERAAQSVIGGDAAGQQKMTPAAAGFRAQDVHVDVSLHRAWVRVRRCDSAAAPLLLVALQAPVAGTEQRQPLEGTSYAAAPSPAAVPTPAVVTPTQTARQPDVRAGDTVTVTLESSAARMVLEGTAEGTAALGEPVAVLLQRRGDEAPQRMRGTVRAGHHVEVQR